MTGDPPRPHDRAAEGDGGTPPPGPGVPAPEPVGTVAAPDGTDAQGGADADTWQAALSALGRMLPADTGRSARSDVERLARNDAQRQARAGERSGERAGRGDIDRLLRLRGGSRTPRAPQRVRVTSSRMAATARAPVRTVSREIDEQTGVGEVYLRSLLRAQLRLGLSVITVLALALGTLPLVFSLVPRLGSVRVFTVPLPWLLVGVSVYPLLFSLAWWHVVAAERAERDFAAIVESD